MTTIVVHAVVAVYAVHLEQQYVRNTRFQNVPNIRVSPHTHIHTHTDETECFN